jgi:hypothetical protein
LDSGLRWALFIPAGVGLSFLVLGLVDAGFAMASGRYRTVPGVFENSVDAFIGDFTRGLFPAVISPRPWLVAIIMFTLDVLLRAGPFAYMLFSNEYMRPRAPRIVTVVAAGFVGGCLALYLVRRVSKSMR